MYTIYGKYNQIICYTDELEEAAASQLRDLANNPDFKGSQIRIMPDVHAGAGCTIGTSMTLRDKVVPNMVGVDIGCGMELVKIEERDLDLAQLDNFIRAKIPSGFNIHSDPLPIAKKEGRIEELRAERLMPFAEARRSIGSLGGGNHFIEVDKNSQGELFIIIHSGSRHLGKKVGTYYQEQAKLAKQQAADFQIRTVVEQMKREGRQREIDKAIKEIKSRVNINLSNPMACVEGMLFEDYIHDMKIMQHFADLNRRAMMQIIVEGMGLTIVDRFATIHNYIDTENMILRKGAVSARKGERLLIPINMRDGSLICIGRGNSDWNYSAPHGAGRLMSRSAAKQNLSMEEFKEQMAGIYSTSVLPSTLDESPMAYKSLDEIARNIVDTADIVERLKPIYNFKAS